MKKLFLLAAGLLAMISFSCEEDFNPKAEFKPKYVLWCIVNGNQNYSPTVQYAIVSRLYDVDGYDPYANRTDPALLGADIRLYSDNNEYLFTQDTLRRADTTRYDSTLIYYRSEPINMRFDSKFRIVAKLPTGEVLTSETSLPQNQGFEFSDGFINGISTLRRDRTSSWEVNWETDGKHIFFPRLRLIYQKKEGEEWKMKSALVPTQIVNKEPYYPDYSFEPGVSYSFDAIDSAMAWISREDTVKSNYRIYSVSFELLEFDTPLSYYYSSVNGYLDNYSIRLDETVYNNINGGIGIFGSTFTRSQAFSVSDKYAEIFGYQ